VGDQSAAWAHHVLPQAMCREVDDLTMKASRLREDADKCLALKAKVGMWARCLGAMVCTLVPACCRTTSS
jgi:hypothetical protein